MSGREQFTYFRDLSIRRKLLLMLVLSSATGLVLAAVALIGYAFDAAREAEQQDVQTLAKVTAANTSAALTFQDVATATEILASLREAGSVELACLYAVDEGEVQQLFAEFRAAATGCPASPAGIGGEGMLLGQAEVRLGGEIIGRLYVVQNLTQLSQTLSGQVRITLSVLGASFLLSFVVAWLMQRYISYPILRLKEVAQRISETHDYSLRAEASGRDEVGELVRDFNAMIARIERSTHEVQRARDALAQEVAEKTRANAKLERALSDLQAATEQLVESEKMASLGALVAGVAHEVNTPVGVALTAASTLLGDTENFLKLYAEGRMKRSDLETYAQVARESSDIILKNLHRAANLIQSFKQVAVDQSSEERRRFAVGAYIEEVLTSLRPKIKRTGHQITVDCPPDLVIDSYPGALAQIITNLVGNSLTHAFPDRDDGHIELRVRFEPPGTVVFDYRDDGVGIPRDLLPKIFDPFFTTKRGGGGSGLGLHIVYNLATRILGGRVRADSTPGEGMHLQISFPTQARREAA